MMTPSELIGEGINLMFSGMGFVLVFLLILIWAIGVMSNHNLNQKLPKIQPHFLRQQLTILSVYVL